jgi:hypothetical protein
MEQEECGAVDHGHATDELGIRPAAGRSGGVDME